MDFHLLSTWDTLQPPVLLDPNCTRFLTRMPFLLVEGLFALETVPSILYRCHLDSNAAILKMSNSLITDGAIKAQTVQVRSTEMARPSPKLKPAQGQCLKCLLPFSWREGDRGLRAPTTLVMCFFSPASRPRHSLLASAVHKLHYPHSRPSGCWMG